jgi:hypothetical protein
MHCLRPINPGELVTLNDQPFHAETPCFAEGLRALTFKLDELRVMFSPTVPPMVAYRAGRQTSAIIAAAHRKTKAKPVQQAFSATSFSRKQR